MIHKLRNEIAKAIVGQQDAVDLVIMSLLTNSHALLVGVPGLAKTTLVKAVSKASGLDFGRIQFTPDLMPSDVIGSEVLMPDRTLTFQQGPLFTHVLLADEINRTPPKTQSALLEAMQEGSVTANGVTHFLPKPFFVLATQNPLEQEGTYPLPEAQLDRFLFFIELGYPSHAEEVEIVKRTTGDLNSTVEAVLTPDDWFELQAIIRQMPVPDPVVDWAVRLVQASRSKTAIDNKPYISWGAGPRASQSLIMAAKAHAFLRGKHAPDKEDVIAVAIPVLRHRMVATYQATADGLTTADLIQKLLKQLH